MKLKVTRGNENMRFIKVTVIIIILSLFITGCGRPGGKSEDNASGSYLEVTNVSLNGDRVSITVYNRFKDSTVTSPNTMYNVTLRSYTLTYYREDGSIILTSTKENSIFIFIEVRNSTDATFTLDPSPDSVSYSSASVYIFGKNGFGDKIGTTFYLPRLGGGTGVSPTVSNVTFDPSTVSAGSSTTVTSTVTDPQGSSDISSVTIDASSVGASSSISLTSAGGDTYSGSFTVSSGTTSGSYSLTVTATDNSGNKGTGKGTLTVQ